LASWSIFPSVEIRQDIDIALSACQKNGVFIQGTDHLCCGNVGRIELLTMAAQLLGDQELLRSAQDGVAKMITTARSNSVYGFLPHLSSTRFSVSFYSGSAGLGYQLLRVADPQLLPSIAIWL
jgi:lantibiotic modifying enzyme